MDISITVSGAGVFRRISLSVLDKSKQVECELSAIITSPSGRDEIFLQSPEKILNNVTYPHSGGRFVTHIGPGKYQIIFQPKESGPHKLKLVGRLSGKPFKKEFQVSFG
jgi:hypothetical protein